MLVRRLDTIRSHQAPVKILALLLLLVPGSLFAQGTPLAGDNPLAELKAEVTRVLSEGKLPFTDEQDRAITLMMEERRQASEGLFGNLMDFRAGPTQRQDEERLRSAIDWLRNEFLAQLQQYLTPQQLDVWNQFRQTRETVASAAAGQNGRQSQQTQYVRINNNLFTAEDAQYRNQGGFGFGNNNQNNNNNNNNTRIATIKATTTITTTRTATIKPTRGAARSTPKSSSAAVSARIS